MKEDERKKEKKEGKSERGEIYIGFEARRPSLRASRLCCSKREDAISEQLKEHIALAGESGSFKYSTLSLSSSQLKV